MVNNKTKPTKPPLSRFLQGLGFIFASPKLCGKAAEQGGCPRSCGRPLCSSTSPPNAARRPATTSKSPWARVAAVAGIIYFSFSPCSAATHARGGNMVFGKPLLLRKSNERPSRLTHSSGFMMGKNTAPAADSTAILKLHFLKKLLYFTKKKLPLRHYARTSLHTILYGHRLSFSRWSRPTL